MAHHQFSDEKGPATEKQNSRKKDYSKPWLINAASCTDLPSLKPPEKPNNEKLSPREDIVPPIRPPFYGAGKAQPGSKAGQRP